MSSYIPLHALLYDHLYKDKDYRREAQFVHRQFKIRGLKKDASLLEIACGTGSHSFNLEKFGYSITATDNSLPMLNVAKSKALAQRSAVLFRPGDMRKLPVFKKKFDGALCLFDSIGYALTNEGVASTLQGIQKNLNPGGTFIFEFWHAAAMIKNYERKRTRTFAAEGRSFTRESETTLDYVNQTGIVKYTITEESSSRKQKPAREIQRNRFFSIPEMKLFLATAGFQPLKFYSGFSANTKIDSDTWHIVAVAQKTKTK